MSAAAAKPPFENDDNEQSSGPDAQVSALLPKFEGKTVDSVSTKFVGSGLNDVLADPRMVIKVDDRVRFVCVGRVTGVNHVMNKDGNLVRQQVVAVIEGDLTPFDPSDPHDKGILRA